MLKFFLPHTQKPTTKYLVEVQFPVPQKVLSHYCFNPLEHSYYTNSHQEPTAASDGMVYILRQLLGSFQPQRNKSWKVHNKVFPILKEGDCYTYDNHINERSLGKKKNHAWKRSIPIFTSKLANVFRIYAELWRSCQCFYELLFRI